MLDFIISLIRLKNRVGYMKKYMILGMVLLLISVPIVAAQTGGLRISPQWSVMVAPEYTFEVWCQTGTAYDVQVLLVITEDCYNGMDPGNVVTVDAVTPITKADFTAVSLNSLKVPPSSTDGYTVASLKDHIDEGLATPLTSTDTIYWALSVEVFASLTGTKQPLYIKLDSTAPRMLVYLMGNLENGSGNLDIRVPPTNPGFMVPEVVIGSIMAVAAMFTALGLYAYKKKHTPTK